MQLPLVMFGHGVSYPSRIWMTDEDYHARVALTVTLDHQKTEKGKKRLIQLVNLPKHIKMDQQKVWGREDGKFPYEKGWCYVWPNPKEHPDSDVLSENVKRRVKEYQRMRKENYKMFDTFPWRTTEGIQDWRIWKRNIPNACGSGWRKMKTFGILPFWVEY